MSDTEQPPAATRGRSNAQFEAQQAATPSTVTTNGAGTPKHLAGSQFVLSEHAKEPVPEYAPHRGSIFQAAKGRGVHGSGVALPRTKWQPDSDSKQCMACLADFGLMRRKHHCRGCGSVVCSECSCRRVMLESEQGFMKLSRVCAPCSTRYDADMQHPLYGFLGAKLAQLYFYRFVRNDDSDVQWLIDNAEDRDVMDAVMNRNKIDEKHRFLFLHRVHMGGASPTLESGAGYDSNDSASDVEIDGTRRIGALVDEACDEVDNDGTVVNVAKADRDSLLRQVEELRAQRDALQRQVDKAAEEARIVNERGETAAAALQRKYTKRGEQFARKEHHRTACELCSANIEGLFKEHHCRHCYRAACGACTTSRHRETGERLCDHCHAELTLSADTFLAHVASRPLLSAYWAREFQEMGRAVAATQDTPLLLDPRLRKALRNDSILTAPMSCLETPADELLCTQTLTDPHALVLTSHVDEEMATPDRGDLPVTADEPAAADAEAP